MRGEWAGNAYFLVVGGLVLKHRYESPAAALRQAEHDRRAHPNTHVIVRDWFGQVVKPPRRKRAVES